MSSAASLRPGTRLELWIDRLSLGGEAVGRFENCAVFVPYGAPGDRLEIEITEVYPRFARGRLLRVLKPSPQRITPPCPYHFRPASEQAASQGVSKDSHVPTHSLARSPAHSLLFCGGCTWQHLTYEAQLKAKQALVQETLERIGGLRNISVLPTLGMENPWRYRNKVQQPVGYISKPQAASKGVSEGTYSPTRLLAHSLITGFYAPSSHTLVPIDDCLIQPELSVAILNKAKTLIERFGMRAYDEEHHRGWIRHLLVRTAGEKAMLVFVTSVPEFPHERDMVHALAQEFPSLIGLHQNVNPARTNVILGRHWRTLAGADRIEEHLGALRFQLSPASFFQVNTQQAEVLYRTVKQMIQDGPSSARHTLIDFYCGVGSIALFLADTFDHVIGVEEVASAVQDAEQNARLNRIRHARFFAMRAESFHRPSSLKPHQCTVVLDPPRAGVAREVLDRVLKWKPSQVVYVSCDPGTLGRDLALLVQGGYVIREVQPVDMFPHTAHIETVVHLCRSR